MRRHCGRKAAAAAASRPTCIHVHMYMYFADGIGEADFVRRKAAVIFVGKVARSPQLEKTAVWYQHCSIRAEQSARWRASRERGELEGGEPSHTATTTRSRHKFSLPTHPRLAQRVVCVLPPSLVIGLWFRVPLVERFVHPRLNGSFNSSTERLVGGKLLKQFSHQVSVCLLPIIDEDER